MNPHLLYPQSFYAESHPHSAIASFVTNWVNTNHRKGSRQHADNIGHDFNQLFASDFPGVGLEPDGTITGFYDLEWMPEEGIEEFETGASFVVTFDGQDTMLFPQVRYSREELSGWFSLALERYARRFPALAERIAQIEDNYYSPSEAREHLLGKIKGELHWAHGPCGRLTREQADSWIRESTES